MKGRSGRTKTDAAFAEFLGSLGNESINGVLNTFIVMH